MVCVCELCTGILFCFENLPVRLCIWCYKFSFALCILGIAFVYLILRILVNVDTCFCISVFVSALAQIYWYGVVCLSVG